MGHIGAEVVVSQQLNELKQMRYQLEEIIDCVANGIVAIDSVGIVKILNPAAENILRINKSEILNKHIKKVLPESQLFEVVTTGISKTVKSKLKGITIIATHSPIKNGKKIYGAVSVFQDISKIEEISTELETMKKIVTEFNAIFENSYDGIYITDGNGNTVNVNPAYERITGLRKKDLIGKNMKDLVQKGIISESITFKIKKTKKPMTITQKIHGGKEILVTGVPVFDENGEIFRVITNVRDMTELNNAKRQLDQSRKLASKYEQELTNLRTHQIGATEVIYNSKEMEEIIELVLRVAKVDSTVLIQGESGVGKEIVANLIHKYSPRKDKGPFIKINCAAIPRDLLESELFGYEEGAFTGAKKEGKPGIFELANNGTLFLDEIADLPLDLQVKLLRVIQFKEIMRLGGTNSKKVNVRLVAATAKNLEQMVKENKFREDLYYRLNVVPLEVPPLRRRKDDIFPLLVYFLDKYNKKYKQAKTFSADAIEILTSYNWPGNVRELANLVERLVVTTKENTITLKNVPQYIIKSRDDAKTVHVFKEGSLPEMLDHLEKKILKDALDKYGSTRKTAQALKISQSSVVRKARKHGIKLNKSWID
ncbi:MAG: sigma 54-interacting transcriptional regulator [Thermoanaerobacteraceae bacterium]|nr:sigma 54-interacting transcriptional regulator [Thermoanaerobacteraceae bacterium]